MTTQTADLVAVMKARDQMSPVFRRAGNEVQRTQRLMGGFNRALAVVGLSTLSLGLAFKGLISAQDRTQKTTASTTLLISQLGPEFALALEEMRPSFRDIAKEFGFLESDAEKAFGILLAESRNAKIGPDDLRAALGLARLAQIDVGTAATAYGTLLRGEAEPIRAYIKDLGDQEKAMRDIIKAGGEATTAANIWSRSWKQAFEDVAGSDAFKQFLEATTPKALQKQFFEDEDLLRPKPPLQVVTETISDLLEFPAFRDAWNTFWGIDVPLDVDELWRGMGEKQEKFERKAQLLWVEKLLRWIQGAWTSMTAKFGEWRLAFTNFWNSDLIRFVRGLWNTFSSLSNAWLGQFNLFWGTGLIGLVRGLWGIMMQLKDAWEGGFSTFWGTTLPDTIRTALGDAVNAVINAIPSWIRDLVTGNFRIPSFLGGGGSRGTQTRHLGGVVQGPIGRPVPVMALAGETFTPRGGSGSGTTMVFNIGSVDSEIRVRQVAREIKRILIEDGRRGVGVT